MLLWGHTHGCLLHRPWGSRCPLGQGWGWVGSVLVPISPNRWADSVLPLRTQTHLMVNLFPEYWIWVVPPFGFGFKWTASSEGPGRKSHKEQKNLGRVSRGPPGSGPATPHSCVACLLGRWEVGGTAGPPGRSGGKGSPMGHLGLPPSSGQVSGLSHQGQLSHEDSATWVPLG